MSELVQNLRRQLGFLEVSSYAFDQGFRDEAIRIAVVLRVLFHDKPGSPSLISQLHAPRVLMRSSIPALDPDPGWVQFSGGLSIMRMKASTTEASVEHVPKFDAFDGEFLPADDWWNQVAYITDEGNITRGTIALKAANKEGAHVDLKYGWAYAALKRTLGGQLHAGDEHGMQVQDIKDIHLSDLRQIAHEVFRSPELLALAAP